MAPTKVPTVPPIMTPNGPAVAPIIAPMDAPEAAPPTVPAAVPAPYLTANGIIKSSDQNITANGLYFYHHSPFTSGIMAIHKSRHANGIQSHKGTFVSSAASATIGQILILIT